MVRETTTQQIILRLNQDQNQVRISRQMQKDGPRQEEQPESGE